MRYAALTLAFIVVACGAAPGTGANEASSNVDEAGSSTAGLGSAGSTGEGGEADAAAEEIGPLNDARERPEGWPDRVVVGISPLAVNQAAIHLARFETLMSEELAVPVTTRIAGTSATLASDLAAGHSHVAILDLVDAVAARSLAEHLVEDPSADDVADARGRVVLQAIKSRGTAQPAMWVAMQADRWCDADPVALATPLGDVMVCRDLESRIEAHIETQIAAQLSGQAAIGAGADVLPDRIAQAGRTVILDASSPARLLYTRAQLFSDVPSDDLEMLNIAVVASARRLLDQLAADTEAAGVVTWSQFTELAVADAERPAVVGIAPDVPYEVVVVGGGLPPDLVDAIVAALEAVADTPFGAQALLDLLGVEGWTSVAPSTVETAIRVASVAAASR
ncbi:MAG: hypothetical protein WD358_00180 [Nitriliruptoraceae bacterium]